MDRKQNMITPIYQKIAVDIASKIAAGEYQEGNKLFARSALASQYSVSPETSRRAISILSDMGIVETVKGSGITIILKEKAIGFVERFQEVKTVNELKKDISDIVKRQESENRLLKTHLVDLLERIDKLRFTNPFMPFDITLKKEVVYLGQNYWDINFWHHTKATVIAIKRGNDLLISPGPYALLEEDDIIYFIGDKNSYRRVHSFLYSEKI